MSIHRPNQLALVLTAPQAAYPERSNHDQPDIGLDAPPLTAVHEVLIAAGTAPPELAKRARLDLATQLEQLARERGRHGVPKHLGADEVVT